MTFKATERTPCRGYSVLSDGHAPIGRDLQGSRQCYKLSGVFGVDRSEFFALIRDKKLRIAVSDEGLMDGVVRKAEKVSANCR